MSPYLQHFPVQMLRHLRRPWLRDNSQKTSYLLGLDFLPLAMEGEGDVTAPVKVVPGYGCSKHDYTNDVSTFSYMKWLYGKYSWSLLKCHRKIIGIFSRWKPCSIGQTKLCVWRTVFAKYQYENAHEILPEIFNSENHKLFLLESLTGKPYSYGENSNDFLWHIYIEISRNTNMTENIQYWNYLIFLH